MICDISIELYTRLKYGDLNEKYRNDVLESGYPFAKDAMISAINVICGNIEIECASALLRKPSGKSYFSNDNAHSAYWSKKIPFHVICKKSFVLQKGYRTGGKELGFSLSDFIWTISFETDNMFRFVSNSSKRE